MKKDIKDYLHLYLGCEIITHSVDGKQVAKQILNTSWLDEIQRGYNPVKPILRPLSNMTEEEGKEAESAWNEFMGFGETISRGMNCAHANRIKYLLSKGFDLFGLIEAGLALDKTTLK